MQKYTNQLFLLRATTVCVVFGLAGALFFVYQNIVLRKTIRELVQVRSEYVSVLSRIAEDKKKNIL